MAVTPTAIYVSPEEAAHERRILLGTCLGIPLLFLVISIITFIVIKSGEKRTYGGSPSTGNNNDGLGGAEVGGGSSGGGGGMDSIPMDDYLAEPHEQRRAKKGTGYYDDDDGYGDGVSPVGGLEAVPVAGVGFGSGGGSVVGHGGYLPYEAGRSPPPGMRGDEDWSRA